MIDVRVAAYQDDIAGFPAAGGHLGPTGRQEHPRKRYRDTHSLRNLWFCGGKWTVASEVQTNSGCTAGTQQLLTMPSNSSWAAASCVGGACPYLSSSSSTSKRSVALGGMAPGAPRAP